MFIQNHSSAFTSDLNTSYKHKVHFLSTLLETLLNLLIQAGTQSATDVVAVKCVTCHRSGAGNEETAVLRDFNCGMTVGATEADLNISHSADY